MRRCDWAGNDELMVRYHDTEWGVPKRDDRRLVRVPGTRWRTGRTELGDHPEKARELPSRVRQVRSGHRCRIRRLQGCRTARRPGDRPQSAEDRCGHRQREGPRAGKGGVRKLRGIHLGISWMASRKQNSWNSLDKVPAKTKESEEMSKDLRSRGFKFVGPTICYAFMQAEGLVNDHLVNCFRYDEV